MSACRPCLGLFGLALVGLAVAGFGCSSLPYAAGIPHDDAVLQQRLEQARREVYPASYAVVQRLVLERNGNESVFNEYVAVRPGPELHVAVLTDLGNSLAEASWSVGGGARIGRRAPGLPERVVQAWLRDARVAYAWDLRAASALVRHADGTAGLVQRTADGFIQEWVFQPDPAQLRRCLLAKGGELLLTSDCEDWGRVEGGERDVPRRLELRNHALGYRASIRVLRLTPTPAPSR